jgi:1-acyl-sn-glycerol-3-phosphate acyltransferase
MLDLTRIERIRLTTRPRVQRLIAYTVLAPNYDLPPRVRIELEHFDRVPKERVIFAMNHTDRYNYWPFQYMLWRKADRFTATWVKGKYYEHPVVATFMELTNNIPTVSRGYLITRDFMNVMGRRPTDEEYGALRDRVQAVASFESASFKPASFESGSNGGAASSARDADDVPLPVLETPRDMLGLRFEPGREPYAVCMDRLFRTMMRRFVALNEETFRKNLDLLVFPQGTRSVRLSRGHIGLAQIALRFGKTVVPVGCSGSDRVYPTSSPIAKRGNIVYRFGEPIRHEEMKRFHIDEPYEPFSAEAERRYADRFQGYVDVVMDRINELVDPEYQRSTDPESDGVRGSHRFV